MESRITVILFFDYARPCVPCDPPLNGNVDHRIRPCSCAPFCPSNTAKKVPGGLGFSTDGRAVIACAVV